MILIVISAISIFWSNNFLVVCIIILVFHDIYSPYPKIIFLWWAIFFPCLIARDWEDFKFLGDLLYWGDLISFLEEEGQVIFFHKAINDQSFKLKNIWWQNYLLHVCMLTFHFFNLKFSLWEFFFCSSVHWNSQKKYSLLLGNNYVRMSILFDMSSK